MATTGMIRKEKERREGREEEGKENEKVVVFSGDELVATTARKGRRSYFWVVARLTLQKEEEMFREKRWFFPEFSYQPHTHTHLYIYIYK